MYEYCVNVNGNNSITYVFTRDTYFPVQELEEMCKMYLTRYGVKIGFSILDGILVGLGFELFDIIGESSSLYNVSVRKEDISINFNFKNV